ncbi:MAG: anhydro-N-acetylmuramic acid kinase [Flavobacteriales bacterium]
MAGTMDVIGVMSGSSLDGIDLACCRFTWNGHWSFVVRAARTVPYASALRQRLLDASGASALELVRLHRDVGQAIGEACRDLHHEVPAQLVASHGHTIFHQPAEGFTTQVGDGARIAVLSGLPTVCDLRTTDVALGGQGAPLVPMGERLLFPQYQAFLNLGGIANLAVHRAERVVGYDIGPCNQALDLLANEGGRPYDANGELARSGTVHPGLLDRLNGLPFYAQAPPRSLGREWFEEHLRPLIASGQVPLNDRLRTTVEHIATMAARELDGQDADRVLVTGGGAHNGLLVERLRALSKAVIEVPDRPLVDFKEAIVFGLLGLLRYRGEANALASVTGAERDSVGGALYLPG